MSLRTIHLYGALGDQFGREHRLAVKTAREAVRALCVLHRGFRAAFEPNRYHVVRGSQDRRHGLDHETIDMGLGSADLHIVPAVSGRGGRGGAVAKIAIGVGLIAGAFFFAPAGAGLFGANLGATAFSVAGVGVSYGNIAAIGLAVALSGVSQLLAPQPKANVATERDRRESFLFNGAVNTTEQGGAIPVVYGRARVGSTVISAGLQSEQI